MTDKSCDFCKGTIDTIRFDPSLNLKQNIIVSFVHKNQPCTKKMVVDFMADVEVCEDCLNHYYKRLEC